MTMQERFHQTRAVSDLVKPRKRLIKRSNTNIYLKFFQYKSREDILELGTGIKDFY